MKYTGRLFVCLISILVLIVWLIYRLLTGKLSETYYETAILMIIIQPVLWLLGKQFDKVRSLNRELQQSKEQAHVIFDSIDACIWSLDIITNSVFVSQSSFKIYGYPPEDFYKNPKLWLKITHPEDVSLVTDGEKKLHSGKDVINEYRIIKKGGEIRWVQYRGIPSFDNKGVLVRITGVVVDITERKHAEEKIQFMAYHDSLTGLPNRHMFNNYLDKSLTRCKRNKKELAVMFIDLDRFKFINDTLGHDVGDDLLRQVSDRLIKSVREGDVVARHGGDEFIILLEDTLQSEVNEIAERILNKFTTPFILEREEFFTSPSIGISKYPNDGQDIVTLTKNADKAMYLAKKRGKNTYQLYIHEDEDLLNRKAKLEHGLKRALDNKEFELYYQPKVELATRNIYGVEALLRWNHPELGFIPPIEFIPIAEETGMIIPIGKWVLQEACKQNKLWQASGIWIQMNVNASSIQFEDNHFVELVKEVLAASQLPPEYLGIEITESVMQDINHSSTIIHELKKVGIKISIDDFGTGYSSLSVINNLPIDVVKIDKSFIDEIMINSNIASLVKTMIQMGENLKFELIAEGIENEQQAKFLLDNGCLFGQGYLYSQPLKKDEIEILLNKQLIRS